MFITRLVMLIALARGPFCIANRAPIFTLTSLFITSRNIRTLPISKLCCAKGWRLCWAGKRAHSQKSQSRRAEKASGGRRAPKPSPGAAPFQPGNSGGALVDERGNVIGVVVAKLSQHAALATSGQLAENVNYAVKSSFLLSLLESLPEVAAKLKEPNSRERKFEEVVKAAQEAAALVLVY